MKLRGSVNRGGITVKTYKEHLLTNKTKKKKITKRMTRDNTTKRDNKKQVSRTFENRQ